MSGAPSHWRSNPTQTSYGLRSAQRRCSNPPSQQDLPLTTDRDARRSVPSFAFVVLPPSDAAAAVSASEHGAVVALPLLLLRDSIPHTPTHDEKEGRKAVRCGDQIGDVLRRVSSCVCDRPVELSDILRRDSFHADTSLPRLRRVCVCV